MKKYFLRPCGFVLLILAVIYSGCGSKPEEQVLDRGIDLFGQNKFKDALAEFNNAISMNTTYAEAYYNRALVYQKLGKLTEAENDLNKIISMNPNFPQPYNTRGLIYANRGQWNKAIADYTKALEVNNTFGMAYLNLAKAYVYKRDYEKAYENARKAIAVGTPLPKSTVTAIEQMTKKKL